MLLNRSLKCYISSLFKKKLFQTIKKEFKKKIKKQSKIFIGVDIWLFYIYAYCFKANLRNVCMLIPTI